MQAAVPKLPRTETWIQALFYLALGRHTESRVLEKWPSILCLWGPSRSHRMTNRTNEAWRVVRERESREALKLGRFLVVQESHLYSVQIHRLQNLPQKPLHR